MQKCCFFFSLLSFQLFRWTEKKRKFLFCTSFWTSEKNMVFLRCNKIYMTIRIDLMAKKKKKMLVFVDDVFENDNTKTTAFCHQHRKPSFLFIFLVLVLFFFCIFFFFAFLYYPFHYCHLLFSFMFCVYAFYSV